MNGGKWRGRVCFYCGAAAETRDHLVPRSRGGLGLRNNQVDACRRCNGEKANRTLDEYRLLVWLRHRRGLFGEPARAPRDVLLVGSPAGVDRIVSHNCGPRPRYGGRGTVVVR